MHAHDVDAWSDEQIAGALSPFGVNVGPSQLDSIRKYMQLLILWNRKVSLTSIADPQGILERHFGESMFAARAVPIQGGRLADVGTGAGFPGLALKLAVPGLHVDLVESSAKKAAFLSEVVRKLGLTGVAVLRHRTEDLHLSPRADWITARAVGSHEGLLEWSVRNLSEGGHVVLWLGAADAAELTRTKGCRWREPIPVPRSSGRVLLVGSRE